MVRGGRPRRGRGRGIGDIGGGGGGRFHRSRSPLERRGGIIRGSRSRYRGGGIRRRTPSPFVPRDSPPHRQRRREPSPFVPRDSPPRRRSHSRRRTPSPFQPRDSIDPLIEAIRRKTEELRRSVERHEQNLISNVDDRINYGDGLQSAGPNEFYSEPNENDDDEYYDYNDEDINDFNDDVNEYYDDHDDEDDNDDDDDNQNNIDDDPELDGRLRRQPSNSKRGQQNDEYVHPTVRIKDPVISLDEKKCTIIRQKILSDIDEILISSNEEPQFNVAIFSLDDGVGYFDIQCANANSEKWLIKHVISWRNLWNGQSVALQCQEAPAKKKNIPPKLGDPSSSRYLLEFHSGRNKVRKILKKFDEADRQLAIYDWIVIRSVCVSGDNIIRVSVPSVAYLNLKKTNMIPKGLPPTYALKLIGEI